ncbi:MAG: hypothetical protein ACYCYO_12900 [Bacilli bacterium]
MSRVPPYCGSGPSDIALSSGVYTLGTKALRQVLAGVRRTPSRLLLRGFFISAEGV